MCYFPLIGKSSFYGVEFELVFIQFYRFFFVVWKTLCNFATAKRKANIMKRTTKAFIASLLLVGSTLTVGAQERISVRKQIHRQEQKSPRKDSGEKKHGMWSIKLSMHATTSAWVVQSSIRA